MIILFFAPKWGNYSREAIIILNTAHWKSCPIFFCFTIPLNKKNNHIKYTVHGLYMCFKFGPLVNFQCELILDVRARIITDQFCCISLHFSFVCYSRCQFLTWQGGDKRKRKWREGWGALFKGGFLKYFRQRVAIIWGGNKSREGYYLRR